MGAPLLGAVLVFAPLIKGGNRPIPLLVLELAALALLAHAAVRPAFAGHLSRTMLAALAALLAIPLLQLMPLPETIWAALPGRDFYAAALATAGIESGMRSISLVPRVTEFAWLALLPPLAVFVVTTGLPDHKVKTLVHVFIGMAVVQAVIGLAQFGTGSAWVLGAIDGSPIDSARGTYANRDHLAGLLEMALPLALALLAANIHLHGGARHPRHHRRPRLRQRLAALFSREFRLNRAALLGAASIAILLGLIFTRSRTGVALAMLGIFLSALAFSRRVGGERSAGLITVFSVIGLALAVEVGLAPVLGRFTDQSIEADSRWSIFAGTLAGIGEFFPLGSGIGTFPEVFRRFQPGDVPKFVNHAHNDYLEWLFEGGLPAAALIAVFLVLYVLRWRQVWTREHWSHLRFAQVAAGISLLLIGLHGIVDFNLHIPANAIYFAFLAGVFFHREEEHQDVQRKHRPEAEHKQEPAPAPSPPVENARNPFAD
ncbi:MAG: O-antigen ligase family protein [Gammaproteobacteria bacterium]|nr:O-antigen ligase family protein [Gammaproteobacteria bacterium]